MTTSTAEASDSAELGRRNGSAPPRVATSTLALLSVPLNGLILRALGEGPLRLADLRREVGGPAQTTLRSNLTGLQEMGAIAKRSQEGKPSVLVHELTDLGGELLQVVDGLEAWLARAPREPIAFESSAAKAAIKALAGGWESTLIRALAARPLTLTELDRLIDTLTYPALERRLGAMRLVGQVSLCPDNPRKRRPYTVTPWLREAVGPLALAARCERRHMAAQTPALARIDVEAGFLLAVPLVTLPVDAEGACQLAVKTGTDREDAPTVGVRVEVRGGRVVSCVARLEPLPSNRVSGPALAWLDGMIDRKVGALEFEGDQELCRALVHGLNEALFSTVANRHSAVALANHRA